VILSAREALQHINTFFKTYHPLRNDLDDHAELCQRRGYIAIGCGRVVEAAWEKYGLSYQQCCNLPVQGIAADCMLRALVLVYDEFRACGVRGGLIATIHDEILCEVHEDDAEGARELLEACMLTAFADTFPRAASFDGVVEAKIGRTWGELK
jgi:DNA polymerase-1